MNVNILGISELKWTGMGEFNSHDHNIYYYGQESFWRNEVTFSDLKERSDQGGYTQEACFQFQVFQTKTILVKSC